MNRFLVAKNNLNIGDELVWYVKRPDGSVWRCLWRQGEDCLSFVSQEIIFGFDENGYCNRREGKVKRAFTIVHR